MNTLRVKPGYKTSEFWFTAVSFIFSGLYLLGIIGDNSQKEDLIRDVSHGVESVILIGGQLTILWKYINSRKEIKKSWWNSTIESETIPIDKNKNGEETNGHSRKSKKSTKKTNKRKPKKSK